MNPLAQLQPVDLAGTTQNALLRGLQVGDAMRQRKQQEMQSQAMDNAYRGAMSGDKNAFDNLANVPGLAKEAYTMRQGQNRQDTIRRAAQGDPTAKLEMWGIDPEVAMRLDKFQTEKAAEGIDFVSNAAFEIVKLPPEQRPQAWEQYIQQGIQMGFDGLAQYQGKYSDQNLNSIVSKSGQMKEFQEFQQPKYGPVGENGMQGFQFGVPIPNGAIAPQSASAQPNTPAAQPTDEAAYKALPEGAQYVAPDGSLRVKGGGGVKPAKNFRDWL